ncbi:MAG TPA: PDZ domain-containing protein [Pyrinomonadaceae bacterium]|nr:PDZ domain-containing protein [Pyrinomonadaceae bacterium]
MNRKNAFYLLVSLLLTCGVALAQQPAPAPPPDRPAIGITPGAPQTFSFFMDGGSFLGVHAEDVNKENMARYGMREARGVGITEVVKDSPAEKAGLRKDDVILRFEGDSVTSVRKLTRLVSEVAPDQNIRLAISRSGGEQEVAVTMGKQNNSFGAGHKFEFPKGVEGLKGLKEFEGFKNLEEFKGLEGFKMMTPPGNIWKWEGQGPGGDGMVWAFGNQRRIGVSTMQLTKQLADYFGVAEGTGVLVTAVIEDGAAAKAGVKAGDVITAVDGEKIDGAGDLSRIVNKKKEGDVILTVIRKKDTKTITVTPKTITPTVQPGTGPLIRRTVADKAVIRNQIRNQIRESIRKNINDQIVIPAISIGTIPAINISTPQINLPVIPEINVVMPKVRVVRSGSRQPI